MSKQKTKGKLEKFTTFIKHPFRKKNEPLLHTVEWIFILLAFFAVGLPILYYQSGKNIFGGGKLNYIGNKGEAPSAETVREFVGETIEEPVVDVTGWDTYRNQWYGFEIRHPDKWTNMQFKTATAKNARYETIYKFRKDSSGENDPYVGFDVAVYSTKKVSDVGGTNDLQKNEGAPEDLSVCQASQEAILGQERNIFQKVSVAKRDACYEPAYFFSIKKDSYLFDILPITKENTQTPENLEQDVNKNFPEYKEVVSSFDFIPVSRPAVSKPTPAKPKITARRPVAAKIVGGKLVCAKKNDKPRKSKKNKPGHLDLECCLDPDERPNPWCTY